MAANALKDLEGLLELEKSLKSPGYSPSDTHFSDRLFVSIDAYLLKHHYGSAALRYASTLGKALKEEMLVPYDDNCSRIEPFVTTYKYTIPQLAKRVFPDEMDAASRDYLINLFKWIGHPDFFNYYGMRIAGNTLKDNS